MSGAYIGSGNSKKLKEIYIGASNLSKKIKKAYVGVSGIAKLWWSSSYGPPVYVGNFESARQTDINRSLGAGAHLSDKMLFVGGSGSIDEIRTADVITKDLVFSKLSNAIRTDNRSSREWLVGVSMPGKALFSAGYMYSKTDVINDNLTVSSAEDVFYTYETNIRYGSGGDYLDPYALILTYESDYDLVATAYNGSLTKIKPTAPNFPGTWYAYEEHVVSNGKYLCVMPCYGYTGIGGGSYISAYDNSLTYVPYTQISQRPSETYGYGSEAVRAGDYALSYGGYGSSTYRDSAYSVSQTLTVSYIGSHLVAHQYSAPVACNRYAILFGGTSSSEIEYCTEDLTFATVSSELYYPNGIYGRSAAVEDVAVFCGGRSMSSSSTWYWRTEAVRLTT